MLKQSSQNSQPAIPLPNLGFRIVPPPPPGPTFCSIDPMPAPSGPQF